jgi:hypothetical protein
MFSTLSNQFRENIAEAELDTILNKLKLTIENIFFLLPNENQTIIFQYEIPLAIGQGFRYSIEITNSSDGKSITLTGTTRNSEIYQELTFTLNTKFTISATGQFTSTSNYLNLNLQKTQNSILINIS